MNPAAFWEREPSGYEHPRRLSGEASARREIAKLKLAIGHATGRKDKKALAYLGKRLEAAQQVIRGAGWARVDGRDA